MQFLEGMKEDKFAMGPHRPGSGMLGGKRRRKGKGKSTKKGRKGKGKKAKATRRRRR